MDKFFQKISVKKRTALVLLYCLDWGCHAKGSSDIEENIRKKLKFQYKFDTIRFRSCIDLIEDTEDAICYYSKYGLQKYNSKINSDQGEIYLKLYGVLNAIYLQINCIIEIFEVCRIPNKFKILENFKNHKIFELRNIVGAHTINFEDKSEYIPENFNKNFFRITQCQLNAKGDNLHAVDGFHNVREYNLYELIMDYNKISEEILFNASIKYMDSIFSKSEVKKTKLLNHYELKPFKNYNYRALYLNDKLQKKDMDRITRAIKKEFGEKTDFRLEDIISSSVEILKFYHSDLSEKIKSNKH